ncbi:hypothetical protein ACSBR2_008137 [Camellia fascicularis]
MRTFHFLVGVATITLQDVSMLFTLHVDGDAITSKDQGNKVEDLIDETVHHYARAYIMCFIRGVLVLDKSQNIVKMMFSPLLRDFDHIHDYSWGGATLACLYRILYPTTKPDTKEMTGLFLLLQVRAWERLVCIVPSRKCNIVDGECAIG